MKKYLLSLIALFMVAIGIKAEVVPAFSELADGEFYLYNVEYKGFLVGANDWGTRASVDRAKGLKINIRKAGMTYQLGAMSPDSEESVWIDGSRDGNDAFTFTAGENGTYTIGCTKFEGKSLTWTGDESNTRLNFTNEVTNGTWGIVSQESYDAYLEAKKAEQAEKEKTTGDYSGRLSNDKAAWVGASGVYGGGAESYKEAGQPQGNIMTQIIPNLPAGMYEIKFNGIANVARNLDTETWAGEGKAFVFANAETKDITIGTKAALDAADWANGEHTFTVAVDNDTLVYGIANNVAAGQWYVCKAISLTRTGDLPAQAPVVAIEEGEGVYTVTSTSADAALYYLCKPMSWLDEGETPESVLQADIEGMGSMIDSEETWELYAHMGMQPAPKAFTVADYQEMYAGEEMFLVAANVGWDGKKLAVISNIEQINFTVTTPDPFISGASVLVNGEETSLNTHSEVSAEQADAVSAQVSPAVRQVFYDLRYMMEIPGEEGSQWIAVDTIDTDEMSINGFAYAELNWPVTFEAGSKYMLTIRALDMDQNEESVSFIINGSYVEPVLANHNFAEGNVGEVNIATYAKDGNPNQMQEVPGWTIGVENGDARAAGVVAYGSKTTLGGAAYGVPAVGPKGTNGMALAAVGVWTGTVKYVQNAVLPAGKYTMTVPVYNTAGTDAFVKNLIGVKYGETEVLATATSYPVGKWTNEIVVFELEEDATVTVSLGYEGANVGSPAAQHLFYDRVDIEPYDELAVAKATAIAALPAAGEGIFCVSQEDIDAAVAAINAAESVEEVEAVAVTIPALEGEWTIQNATIDTMYINGAVIATEPAAITFEQAEGGFYIKSGEQYINMRGDNNWSISTDAEAKTAWTFAYADGKYTIQGPKGSIGIDYGIKAADNTDINLYGNKSGNGTAWTIVKIGGDYGITFDVEEGAEISLDSVKSIHISIATPEGIEPAGDLYIEGVLFGKDGTNQPILGFTDFEDGVDVNIARLTPGNAYTINITKMAYGKEVGFDEETYMPIYEYEITAAEGEALASLNFSIAVPTIEVGEITAVYNEAGPVIVITFEDQEDVVPSFNVDILLNGEKLSCEYGQEWNEIYAYPGAKLADGEYTIVFPAGSLTFDSSIDNTEECSVSFTVGAPVGEIAVSLIAEDETEYALNTHSTVTVDMPIAGIKVTGLDQIMDTVTYAILGKDKTTVASGILSVNTIGYAEFVTPVSLYEGNDYVILIATKDSVLADMQVIGAAEPAEIEIAATLNGEVAINTHSEVSVEKASEIEVTFDGVVPTEAGYIICKMKNVESEEGLLWEVDEELEHGMLSLNGKGYAEFEEIHRFAVGTKYLIVVAYSTADGKRTEVNFVINGSYDADADAINAIAADAAADGKYLENGKIVIVKAGVKYNTAGQIIR